MDSTFKGHTNGGFEYANRHTKSLEKRGSPDNITNLKRSNPQYPNVPNKSEIDVATVEPRFVRESPQSAINDASDNRSNTVDSLNNHERSTGDGRYMEILQDDSQVYLINSGLINDIQSFNIYEKIYIFMKQILYLIRFRSSEPSNPHLALKIQYIMMFFQLLVVPASAQAIHYTMM